MDNFFSTPTLGSLIFVRSLLVGAQNIFDAYSLLTPLPPVINNDRSLSGVFSLLIHNWFQMRTMSAFQMLGKPKNFTC